MLSCVMTTAQALPGSVGQGRPASWYVPGWTATVSPGAARSSAPWIESRGPTMMVLALAGTLTATSPAVSSHAVARIVDLLVRLQATPDAPGVSADDRSAVKTGCGKGGGAMRHLRDRRPDDGSFVPQGRRGPCWRAR